mmetsp:Transcript_27041/g.62249  ORF Transcript_27041/g.62249 Transcript_27041/m.62249 type:complete len:229 (+) Transcript_27041:383-1069(+)
MSRGTHRRLARECAICASWRRSAYGRGDPRAPLMASGARSSTEAGESGAEAQSALPTTRSSASKCAAPTGAMGFRLIKIPRGAALPACNACPLMASATMPALFPTIIDSASARARERGSGRRDPGGLPRRRSSRAVSASGRRAMAAASSEAARDSSFSICSAVSGGGGEGGGGSRLTLRPISFIPRSGRSASATARALIPFLPAPLPPLGEPALRPKPKRAKVLASFA